ncbi:MAG: response regulator [Clostridiales bacterium]|nr:response regulator [Clostridiales bacterium]
MKLVWKLAIPQIIIVVCLGLISYFVIDSSFISTREQYVRDVIENRLQFITGEIEASARKSVNETSVFVNLPAVIQAYELALSGDIDDPWSPESQAARELLRRELAVMLDSYYDATGERLQLHFHLPNGFSLVRLWRDKNTRIDGEWVDISDDLRSYRTTVLDVLRSGEPSLGLEPGSGGFAIRGVIPVLGPDGALLGSAEVLQDFDPILEAATEEGKVYISLYANVELLEFSVELQDADKYPRKGEFVRVVEAKDSGVDALITPELLEKGRSGILFEDYGTVTLATFPLASHRGEQVGVIICAMETETVSGIINTAVLVMGCMLVGMTLIPIVVLLIQIRRLATTPLTMITTKIQDIAEDRADLTEQIPSSQKDEIGELAGWFNTLTAKLDAILQEHREMSHWYKSILDATPLPITVTDADMNWTFVNTAVEEFLGTKMEDMLGKPCSNWDAHICGTEDCGIACARRGLKETFFKQKGRSHKVDVEVLRDLHGETAGYIEIVQDITQIEEMARHEAEANAASQAKSEFLANMSHEIRTPMNAIMGMTAVGKSAPDVERARYALGKIEDASVHLLGVINDILDMSKIEAGKFELSEDEFNFEKMLQRVVNIISFRVDEKKLKFSLYIDEGIPAILVGDDQRLAQIITNLLGNAVKFTPAEGSVSLSATLEGEAEDLWEIRIEVADSGIGISPEQQARLFQTFQQADSGTSKKFGGTGLGLSISKSIVEMMGGRIWVESQLDQGATFAFTVRMRRGDPHSYELSVKETNWSGLRILAIDGDSGVLSYLKNLIERNGALCDAATCGADAMELVHRNGAYDIYFIDWKLADIDALQLTRGLKAIEPGKSKIVITMISGSEWGDIEESARSAGVDMFLAKPLFPSTLVDTINGCLDIGAAAGAAAGQLIEAGERYDFSGKVILIAEDVEINREIMSALLEETGVAIDFAEHGELAVSRFREQPGRYDLILMDIQMPEMDGYTATRVIRALDVPRAEEVPIIAMTANVFREDVEKCLEAGMNDHIGKPINTDELYKKISEYI